MQPQRLLDRILKGDSANVGFADLVRLVQALGFTQAGGRGSHRVFAKRGVKELLNLQEIGGQAKSYQVRQLALLVRRYDLQLEERG